MTFIYNPRKNPEPSATPSPHRPRIDGRPYGGARGCALGVVSYGCRRQQQTASGASGAASGGARSRPAWRLIVGVGDDCHGDFENGVGDRQVEPFV
jgi:hypothetical protein